LKGGVRFLVCEIRVKLIENRAELYVNDVFITRVHFVELNEKDTATFVAGTIQGLLLSLKLHEGAYLELLRKARKEEVS